MAFVELRDVVKSFGKTDVIKGISADIEPGEFIVILGPSGCGKSTLLRMIAGLEDLSGGEIHIAGKRVDPLPPKDRGCAMVFQNYALYPHLSVAGNIEYGLRVAGMPKADRRKKVEEVAELLELDKLLSRKPAQLSGGQRQRVAIARAIAREPSVFLFDEPLSNLDAKLRTTMRTELRKLHDRIGATSIFVTHDQVEAMTLADRIILLNEGRMAQMGTPSELYDTQQNIFTASFVGAPQINLFPAQIEAGGLSATTSSGAQFTLGTARPGLTAGQPVKLGIRPECIRISETGTPATVDYIEDLGGLRHVFLKFGTQELRMASMDHGALKPGQPVHIDVDPDNILVFQD